MFQKVDVAQSDKGFLVGFDELLQAYSLGPGITVCTQI